MFPSSFRGCVYGFFEFSNTSFVKTHFKMNSKMNSQTQNNYFTFPNVYLALPLLRVGIGLEKMFPSKNPIQQQIPYKNQKIPIDLEYVTYTFFHRPPTKRVKGSHHSTIKHRIQKSHTVAIPYPSYHSKGLTRKESPSKRHRKIRRKIRVAGKTPKRPRYEWP